MDIPVHGNWPWLCFDGSNSLTTFDGGLHRGFSNFPIKPYMENGHAPDSHVI